MRLPEVGERFRGRFEIAEVLGRGGFACVYRARDLEVARDVVIKVLDPAGADYREATTQRFMREARVLAQLDEPHAITLFDFGRSEDGLLYMVFEHVRGRDLAAVLGRDGPLPAAVVEHIVRQVLAALHAAHRLGVLHRDIKPANVIIHEYMGDPYRAKLIDFGIAKPIIEPTHEPRALTREGVVVGTPRYMAPEQFFGDELTPATDIYSLGLVAHEMLLGDAAVVGGSADAVIARKLSPTPIRLPETVGTPALRAVIDRMTARDVRARFPHVPAVLAALDAGISQPLPVRAPSPPSAPTAPPGTDARRFGPWLGIVATVATVAVIAVAVAFSVSSPTAPAVPPQRASAPGSAPSRASNLLRQDTAEATAAEATAEPTGCGEAAPTGIRRHERVRDLHRRTYLTYVPQGYDATVHHPVVLMFHRDSSSAERFLRDSAMAAQADAAGFVIVAFDAADKTSPFTEAEEFTFVAEQVRALAERLCIDEARVYALGDGSGGRFARNLACAMPLSAVAETASGQHPDEVMCASKPPTPMIRLFGRKDRDVPARGGSGCSGGRPFVAASEIERQWRARNACEGAARVWMEHSGGTCTTWSCQAPFVHCDLDGGHDWPTAAAPLFELPQCAEEAPQFPFGEAIWRFFDQHGRRLDGSR